MLISQAYAQAGPAGQGDFFVSLLPLVLIFVVFYFLLIRPQQRKMKAHRDLIASIKRGDKILTNGGIIGTVVKVEGDDTFLVEIAKDVRVQVARGMVADLANKPAGGGAAAAGAPANDAGARPGLMSQLFGKK
jgi:preprotein translocase subunit YajC